MRFLGSGTQGQRVLSPREGDLAKPGRRAAACTRPGTRRAGGETAPGPSPSSPPQVPQLGSAGSVSCCSEGTVGSAEVTSVQFRGGEGVLGGAELVLLSGNGGDQSTEGRAAGMSSHPDAMEIRKPRDPKQDGTGMN